MLADIGIELDYISQLLRQTTVSLGTYRATTTKKDKTKSIAGVSLLRWYKTRLFGIQSKWMNISGRPLGATPSVRLQQGFIKPTPVPFGWFGIFFLTNYSHTSVDWCFTKCQKCVAADGKSADIQLANCSARARLLFQSQTQMKSCLHRFCPCWQSEGRSRVGTRLGVMVGTKRRQLSAKAAHKHLQTTYLGYVNAFLLIGYFSPKGTFQQTAVYVCTDSSYLTFPARVMLHLRGWRDTHRSWSFVNSLFSLHTEKKKYWLQKRLSSLLFLQQGRQARGPTCEIRQSRTAEWVWTLPLVYLTYRSGL